MHRSLVPFAVSVLALASACGSADCGDTGLIVRNGRCECPDGTHYVCDDAGSACECVALLGDGGVPADAAPDAGCTAAGATMCDATCVDVQTSPDHCGACDTPCAAPNACHDGVCRDPIVHASAGYRHTCAVHASGRVSCWGSNTDGQLGDGTFEQRLTPRYVVDLTDAEEVVARGGILASMSNGHSCSRLATGRVACWGNAYFLGTGSTSASNRPVEAVDLDRAIDLDMNMVHACAARSDGHVLCWGSNMHAQLGISTSTTSASTPQLVGDLGGISNARAVATSVATTCALLDDATVSCWGGGEGGGLGDGTTPVSRRFPGPVPGLTGVTEIASGLGHTCALLDTGEVACWGVGHQLGVGITGEDEIRSTPVLVTGIDDAVDLDSAFLTTCVAHADGAVSCWGTDVEESLRSGSRVAAPVPVRVDGVSRAREVTAGGSHVCVVTMDDWLECLGQNTLGQLGDGTTVDRLAPTPVRDPI